MQIIAQTNEKICYGHVVSFEGTLEIPFAGLPFVCLVWDHVGSVTIDQKVRVCSEILHAGCRYAVCGGKDCEQWHDIFDEIDVWEHLDDIKDELDSNFVDTTWHTNESIEDVVWFFEANTNIGDHDFRTYLVLQIGNEQDVLQVNQIVRTQFGIQQES